MILITHFRLAYCYDVQGYPVVILDIEYYSNVQSASVFSNKGEYLLLTYENLFYSIGL